MKFYRHKDYEDYKAAQVEANHKKIERVFCEKEEIRLIVEDLKNCLNISCCILDDEPFGICHGARNGWEVQEFQKYFPDNKIIGTDISPTAKEYGLVEWDFHKENPDWIGKAAFIYTNSLDHSYAPHKAVRVWLEQLAPWGVLYLSHSSHYDTGEVTKADCLSADFHELEILVPERCDFSIIKVGGLKGINILSIWKEELWK